MEVDSEQGISANLKVKSNGLIGTIKQFL